MRSSMKMPRSLLPCVVVVAVAVAVSPLGCKAGGCGGGEASPGPSAVASAASGASAVASASVVAPRVRPIFVRATGVTGALFRAANTLTLRDEQRATLEKIASDVRDSETSAREGDGGA